MPDMLAMLQSNTVLAGLLAGTPQRVAPIALPGSAELVADFGTALSGLLVPGLTGKAKGDRQPDAEGGKDLPVTVEATSAVDPMIAWLPEGLGPILLPADFPLPEATLQPVTASPVEPLLMPGMPASVDPLATVAGSSVPDEDAPVVTAATLAAQPKATLPGTSQAIEQVAPQASQPAEPQVSALVTQQLETPAEPPVFGQAGPQAEPQVPQQGSPQIALDVTPKIAPQPTPQSVLQLPPQMTIRIAPDALSPGSPHEASRMEPQPVTQTALRVTAPIVPQASTQAQTATQPATIVEMAAPNAMSKPENVEVVAAARNRFDLPEHDFARSVAPARVPLPPAPTLAISPAVTAGAAAQVFAAALAAPATPDAGPADRIGEAAILLGGHARTEQLTIVQAMSGTSQAPLDLTQDDWTGAMIDRIAALRDSAEAADTRIKLAPENLGALEVSIRRDGDRIHVHFTAENPAARQIIADAAPRLAELADARGVKLGQTSVDGGGEQGARREPQQQPAQTAARNSLVRPLPDAGTDQRIA